MDVFAIEKKINIIYNYKTYRKQGDELSVKKVVGIAPLWDDRLKTMWCSTDYVKAIEACGASALIIPITTDIDAAVRVLSMCDGFFVTGGQDVNPACYGEDRLPQCGANAPLRDMMEPSLFRYAKEHDMPTMCVCRGIQSMNVSLGGTLYQDLPTQNPSDIKHRMAVPFDRFEHDVEFPEDSPLFKILEKNTIKVNSTHHQAVKRVADNMKPAAFAPDGVIEAIYYPEKKFFLGLQWHPEMLYTKDPDSKKIYQAFVDAL